MSLAGKNWHDDKKPFRPNAGLTSYAKRAELRKQQEAVKEHEKELKEEKEAERQVRKQTEESSGPKPRFANNKPGPYPKNQRSQSRKG